MSLWLPASDVRLIPSPPRDAVSLSGPASARRSLSVLYMRRSGSRGSTYSLVHPSSAHVCLSRVSVKALHTHRTHHTSHAPLRSSALTSTMLSLALPTFRRLLNTEKLTSYPRFNSLIGSRSSYKPHRFSLLWQCIRQLCGGNTHGSSSAWRGP